MSFFSFSQTNHLSNGSFEDWDNLNNIPVGWQLDTRIDREQSSDAIDGINSLKLSSDELDDLRVFKLSLDTSEWFPVEAETTYTLTYSFKVLQGTVEFFSGRANPTVGLDYGKRLTSNINNNEWITITQQFTTRDSSNHYIELLIQKINEGSSIEVLIDDVRLESGIAVYPDREALVALYQSTNGPNWTYSWDYHRDISLFPFSTYNDEGRLISLFLYDNNMSGLIPSEIGNLTELDRLEIQESSNLRGQIPPEIGNLTKLTTLNFTGCDLQGDVPSTLGFLTSLETLRLGNNRLTSIPLEIENLSKLEQLDLSRNPLNIPAPETFSNLIELRSLNLSYINYNFSPNTTPFPNEILQLQKLEYLNMENSWLEGEIPSEIWNMPALLNLDLSNNILFTDLPSSFGNSLQVIDLSYNSLNEFPINLEPSFSLQKLDLSNCGMYGMIPDSFKFSLGLVELNLSDNQLLGDIPLFENTDIKIDVQRNSFVFEDLIDLVSAGFNITYNDQNEIGFQGNISLNTGETLSIFVNETSEPTNQYHWFKNGTELPSFVSNTLTITDVSTIDSGVYSCQITNLSVPNLTLVKRNETVTVVRSDDNDDDGVLDPDDNCPDTPTGESTDSNGCSQSQLDDDNDGVNNNFDTCPNTPTGETVNSNGCSQSQLDDDNDDVNNNLDTCPSTPTGQSVNSNGCAQSQLDDDNDGVKNNLDTCPNTPTGDSVNTSGCGQSQLDSDNDGIVNNLDNCLNTPNGQSVNENGCAAGEANGDDDSDGVTNNLDSCPNTPTEETVDSNGCSQGQLDIDIDGIDNTIDQCSNTPIGETVDSNGCSQSQLDDDNDGIMNNLDNCPNTPTGETFDSNGCSQSQLDDDGDGVFNNNDTCPNTPPNTTVDASGCPMTSNDDADDDGVIDSNDDCPNTPTGEMVDVNGCSQSQLDDDNDGVMNDMDTCPNTPPNTTVDSNGCPITSNDDADNDGVIDSNDDCPNTPTGETVDANGCAQSQLDDDNDGVMNDMDTCPNTPPNTTVDSNGCPITSNDDADNDGVIDSNDDCPNTPTGETVDVNGCSQSELDDDNDGVMNDMDTCPNTPAGVTVDSQGCTTNQTSEPNISNNGIQIKVTSTTCADTENGEISVSFDQDYSYTVRITATLLDNAFDNVNATSGLVRSDLPAGTYTVCVTIPEFQNFERCSVVKIETPEDFTTGKIVLNSNKRIGKMTVSGSKDYILKVNDNEFRYSFNNTNSREISFELEDGLNTVIAKTDKECQGTYEESVLLNVVRTYPNPVVDKTNIVGIQNSDEAAITVSNMSGSILKRITKPINNASISFSMQDLAPGVYLVHIISAKQDVQTKIVKK
jgi:hypothetical protein